MSRALLSVSALLLASACPPAATVTCPDDAGMTDSGTPDAGAGPSDSGTPADSGLASDAGLPSCSADGNPGSCIDATVCGALPAFTASPGYCAGPANIQCCALTPNVANNPPVPSGWTLMAQANVTPEMTAWAVAILNDPATYPIFSVALQTFGSLTVMARVEWHPPDFQNAAVHRGVTLYQ